ncbi:MAG: FliA/WhiG family RNA polymerase sigma factor [Planctomycetota bacterium]|jgi:RNA polymerase sigma factor for flagellar operon FliA
MATDPSPTQDDQEQVSTQDLWVAYKADGDPAVKEELVNRHQATVRFLAERTASKLPKSVDVDDLIQEGNFGLMDAIEKFDLDRNIKFKTYCSRRITGAMLDSLRANDWVSRLTRQRHADITRFREEFEQEQGRQPSVQEIAEGLDLPEKSVRQTEMTSMHSISDRRPTGSEAGESMIDILGESSEANPFELVHRKDLVEVLTRSLTDRERLILQLYFIESRTLSEIGEILSITESRVSQIRTNTLERLKKRLGEHAEQFEA